MPKALSLPLKFCLLAYLVIWQSQTRLACSQSNLRKSPPWLLQFPPHYLAEKSSLCACTRARPYKNRISPEWFQHFLRIWTMELSNQAFSSNTCKRTSHLQWSFKQSVNKLQEERPWSLSYAHSCVQVTTSSRILTVTWNRGARLFELCWRLAGSSRCPGPTRAFEPHCWV